MSALQKALSGELSRERDPAAQPLWGEIAARHFVTREIVAHKNVLYKNAHQKKLAARQNVHEKRHFRLFLYCIKFICTTPFSLPIWLLCESFVLFILALYGIQYTQLSIRSPAWCKGIVHACVCIHMCTQVHTHTCTLAKKIKIKLKVVAKDFIRAKKSSSLPIDQRLLSCCSLLVVVLTTCYSRTTACIIVWAWQTRVGSQSWHSWAKEINIDLQLL